jgi:hypothetical protein
MPGDFNTPDPWITPAEVANETKSESRNGVVPIQDTDGSGTTVTQAHESEKHDAPSRSNTATPGTANHPLDFRIAKNRVRASGHQA